MSTSSPSASRSASKHATTAVAHLLIHTRDVQSAPLEQLLQRCTALWPGRVEANGGCRICVEDLQGQQVLDLQPVHSPMDVVLAPGTYHVNAQIGALHRNFTVTLQQDMRFELFLHRAAACKPLDAHH